MFLTYKIALKAFSVCGLFYPIIFSLFYRAIDFIFNRCFEPFCYFLISFIFHFCTFSFFPFSIIFYYFLFFPIFSIFLFYFILQILDGNCSMMEIVKYLKERTEKLSVSSNFFEKIVKFFKEADLDGNGEVSTLECFCILPKLENFLRDESWNDNIK